MYLRDLTLPFVFLAILVVGMAGGLYKYSKNHEEFVRALNQHVRERGCFSAEQSYNNPNIFYLRCPDGIEELDLSER